MKLQARAASAVIQSGAATLVVTALQIAQLIVIGRCLDEFELGLFAIAMLATTVTQLGSDAGLSAFVIHKQSLSRDGVSSLFRSNLIASGLLFLALWCVAPWISSVTELPALTPLLRAVALVAPVFGCSRVFEALLQREMRFGLLGSIQVIASCLGAAVTIWLVQAGWGASGAIAGVLVSTTAQSLPLLVIGLHEHRPQLTAPRVALGRPLRFGAYQVAERLLNLLSQRVDQLMLLALVDVRAVGVYNLLQSIVSVPLQRINPVLTRVAMPVFARVQSRPRVLSRAYLTLVDLVMTIDAALLAGLAAVAPLALPLVFGPERAGDVPLLQALCFVALQRAIGNPMGSLVLATGRARTSFAWNAALFVLSVPTVWIGATLGGAFGVAIALGALQMAIKVPAYGALIRPIIGSCGPRYAFIVLRPIALACIMAASVAMLSRCVDDGWVALSGLIVFGAAVYVALCAIANRRLIRLVATSAGLDRLRGGRWNESRA